MAKLEDVSIDELHDALDNTDGKKETQRLLLAILYKQGPSVPMIADWFDMRERTLYDWFDRLEEEPIEEAIRDKPRPGRPTKLSEKQREAFEAALEESPTDYGFDSRDWTPEAAQAFIRRKFDVEYTRRHVQRLLKEARISW